MHRVVGFGVLCIAGRLVVACGASAEGEPDGIGAASQALRPLPPPGDTDPIAAPAPRPTRPPPTDPTAPAPATNAGPNLVLDGGLLFSGFDDPPHRKLEIYVTNNGNGATSSATGHVTFAGIDYPAEMHIDRGETFPTALPAGQSGFLLITIPAPAIAQCMTFPVVIDTTHTLEGTGRAASVYADNSGSPATQCLTWLSPLNEYLIEKTTIDSLLVGKSLKQIVNSEVQGSPKGFCNQCHNGNPTYTADGKTWTFKYHPSTTSGIDSTSNIGGWSWAGPGGWAHEFATTTAFDKPADLREAFQRWENNGSPSGVDPSSSGQLDQPPTMMGP